MKPSRHHVVQVTILFSTSAVSLADHAAYMAVAELT